MLWMPVYSFAVPLLDILLAAANLRIGDWQGVGFGNLKQVQSYLSLNWFIRSI